jgi:KUP system potassium uptake protein
MIGALGVVFGDIGTSPIYAFRESIKASGSSWNSSVIFGVLSLVFWAVILVVAVKYVLIVMRADNDGEGGTMALLSLVLPASGRIRSALLIIGLRGAIAVLRRRDDPAGHFGAEAPSEGVQIVTPLFEPTSIPLAAAILVGLFLIQSLRQRKRSRTVLRADHGVLVRPVGHRGHGTCSNIPRFWWPLDPTYAISFRRHAGRLDSLYRTWFGLPRPLTGERGYFYADMGRLPLRAIRIDWFLFVMPALVQLLHFGQRSARAFQSRYGNQSCSF